jgi:CDP-paratose 2-epimerase
LKVLVTGGGGFIGSHVAAHFSAKGAEVTVCDNLSRPQTLKRNVGDYLYNWKYLRTISPSIRLRKFEIENRQALLRAAKGAKLIIHAAGQVAVTTSVKDPLGDFETNSGGTLNVLEAARLNDSTVMFCSTNKVYGENVNSIVLREEATRYSLADPVYRAGIPEGMSIDQTRHSPYGSSKLSADIYVQEFAHTYGLKTGVFRMSCIYGERQFGVEDQGWLAWFVIATVTGKPITIYGNGKQVRDVLYVKDLIDVFNRFADSNLRHAVFNIGGGLENTISLLELLELLEARTGKRPQISFSDWRPADQKLYVSDIRMAQEKLGWKPTVSPEAGVEKVLNWVQEHKKQFN